MRREGRAISTDPVVHNWADYWDGIEHRHIFVVEARDHVARLRAAVAPRATDRVLDFGCGFGHLVALLAPSVAHVSYWDAAAGMREATAARTAGLADVGPLDLSGPVPPDASGTYDLVLANSVVQYMTPDDLGTWLDRWGTLLAPQGRIVVSDIPTPDGSALGELAGMLRFAARHGFLRRAVVDGIAEARRYRRSRGSADLQRWTADGFMQAAAAAGLDSRVLRRNLTHRADRLTVVLTPR
ncbi:MAG: class I SAM-dependent methyltransferase [Pseudonocardia sp.]